MTARPSLAPPRSQHAPSATATGPPRPPGPATAATLPSRAPSTASTKRPDPIHLTGEASKSTRSRQTASTAGAAKPLASSLRLDVPRRPSEDGPPPKSVTFAAPPKPGPIDAPRGKPQLRFGPTGAASAGASDPSSSALSDAAAPGAPPPMPYRPGSMVPVEARRPSNQIVRGPAGQTPDPVGRPYVMEPSPAAPHLGPKKRADFFPYVGHHPEDKLSDFVIRQGFFDKTQISREELTARNVLLPVLKHRRGLKRLSTFFVSVLEQRQQRHRVTAPSSFKPPPRVTLTDTKRETWLRDLASPAVPLRRLSRTIPHGVRGKGLLEQCLGKYVPVERAVWLAKCVGANEMRAFRRKGAGGTFAVGGEVKWVRDWTINVEQFLESMVDACGQKDWKAQMDYTIRLTAHLFAAHLLDREHYFDWLLAALDAASLDQLPLWLLL
ncbi:MAG: RNA polymerase II mediator complex subunit, partial [Thelocarpon superellum]